MLALTAPAKINWTLAVLDKRPDGFHAIQSLMQTISLCDELTFAESKYLRVASGLNIPAERNLVYRAAQALRNATGCADGAAITLVKDIPTGAGLGGGSSDAAAALKGLNILWGLGLSDTELAAIGATVGSDVPFFFAGPGARVEGRGEVVTPMPMTQSYPLLLVYPSFGISTAWAYSELSQRRGQDLTNRGDNLDNIQLLFDILEKKDFSRIQPCLRNDLEEAVAARYSVIAGIRQQLLDAGAAAACMSGSGSTVFGVFSDESAAAEAAVRFPGCWTRVVRTLTLANESGK